MPSVIRKLFFYESWAVAWRFLLEEGAPLPCDSDRRTEYSVLQTDSGHWAADPFLITSGDKTWLFFEYMPYHSNRASIGCCEMTPQGPGKIREVLKSDGHLSYPAVFSYGSSYYMVPETLDRHCIALYRSDSFPDSWSLHGVLKDPFNAVDSTPYVSGSGMRLLVYDPDEPAHKLQKLFLCDLDPDKPLLSDPVLLKEYPEKLGRPAGNLIRLKDGRYIRPTQDCRSLYGGGIRFLDYTEDPFSQEETTVGTLSPEQIGTDLPYSVLGVHTYNRSGRFEVIDVFYRRFSILKPFRAILRRFK